MKRRGFLGLISKAAALSVTAPAALNASELTGEYISATDIEVVEANYKMCIFSKEGRELATLDMFLDDADLSNMNGHGHGYANGFGLADNGELRSSDGEFVCSFKVSEYDTPQALSLNTTVITAGIDITISSFVLGTGQ